MSVLVIASAQPATPPATESEAFVVVTAAEEVIGTWVARFGSACIRFDEDGTRREAWTVSMLDGVPFATSTFRFDEAVMLVTEVAVDGVPSCGEVVARYEVRLLESANLQMVAIEDPCRDRVEHVTTKVYERVE